MEIWIYELIDPRDKMPFYVGKTNNPKVRLKGHRSGRGITPCAVYISSMKVSGVLPEMKILEECTDADWESREAYWVERRQSEFGTKRILNVCEGGRQYGRFGKHTEATCQRLREKFLGRPLSEEQKAQISAFLTGRKQSPETVAKRLKTWNERRLAAGLDALGNGDAHYNEKRRNRNRANGALVKGSEEWKRHLSEKTKAQFAAMTPEEKEARYAPFRGKVGANKGRKFGALSAEQRAKLSEIHKKRLASLTPEQREARMAAAREARKAKLGY